MPNTLGFLQSVFRGPYSVAFVLLWSSMMLACIGLWTFESSKKQSAAKVESVLFWMFGAALMAFASFRPIGIARDDLNYLEIYNTVCPTLSCGQWVQGSRDWGWYSLVGLLKSLEPNPKIMLWLGAAALLLKLAVFYSLTRRPLFVLLLYLGMYYQAQDITALRISLALSAFMISIWLVVKLRTYSYAWSLFVCGLFHKQAFVAPLILVGGLFKHCRWLLITVCVALMLLTLSGIYPDLHQMVSKTKGMFQNIAVNQGLDTYLTAKKTGVYSGWRNAPIVVYPQIIFILWFVVKNNQMNAWLESLLLGCLVMGCFFLWGGASLPEVQMRFFDFFMMPTVLLVGVRRLNLFEGIGLVAVSGIYVLKYNVLHHLLI